MIVIGDPKITSTYISSHVWYVLTELLKNACRVVIEVHGNRSHSERGALGVPPVLVTITHGADEVQIRVLDHGTGISDELRKLIWSYMFTTVDKMKQQLQVAGCGVGLPVSKLYAGYFGGSLNLADYKEGEGALFTVIFSHRHSSVEQLVLRETSQ